MFDRVLIGEVHVSERKLLKRFRVSMLPVLINYITIDKDFIPYYEMNIELFTDDIVIHKVIEFCERHALSQKRWISKNLNVTLIKRNSFKNATYNEINNIIAHNEARKLVIHMSENGIIPDATIKFFEKLT